MEAAAALRAAIGASCGVGLELIWTCVFLVHVAGLEAWLAVSFYVAVAVATSLPLVHNLSKKARRSLLTLFESIIASVSDG